VRAGETNRILKAEIMREHHEYLLKKVINDFLTTESNTRIKYERLSYNYANYDTSHAIEGKSLEINFFSDNESNIKRIITEAIELIGTRTLSKNLHYSLVIRRQKRDAENYQSSRLHRNLSRRRFECCA
jgi:hypothetical protein